jgi:hypothetical protein
MEDQAGPELPESEWRVSADEMDFVATIDQALGQFCGHDATAPD